MKLRLILAALLLGVSFLFCGLWDVFGNKANVDRDQKVLEQVWDSSLGEAIGQVGKDVELPKPLPGDALARIRVPALGQQWIVVEGTDPGDIATAPGHYEFSAMPGQKGNFAVAGHREPGLFWDLDKIRSGDEIVVESRKGTFTYVVTKNFITDPQSWPEVQATPPGFKKGQKILTLTTCNPKWDNYERLVIHAVIGS